MSDYKNIKLNDFKVKTYDKLRYSDTDRQGHVNNAAFATFFETGRVEILYNNPHQLFNENCLFVIANLNINLLLEIYWPGIVDIGSSIKKIGTSSIVVFQGLYQDNKLVATAESVIVQVNDMTKKSSPLTDETKKALMKYLISE
jgi:acyl-CoA thioester hydrolase